MRRLREGFGNREEWVRRLGEFRREEKRLRSHMRAIFKYCSWAFDTKKEMKLVYFQDQVEMTKSDVHRNI